MSNVEIKVKKWIELIQREQLSGIIHDIKASNLREHAERSNKHIFKLLLYLSHVADKCDKKRIGTGEEIYELTCFFCSNLTEIPDRVKFVSSLFHIIRCLLSMRMYDEASKINRYLKLKALCYSQSDISNILIQITYLWHNTTNNVLLTLQKDPSILSYQMLKNILKYEFETSQIAYKNCTKHVLITLNSCLDKFASISKEQNTYLPDSYKFATDYLNERQISLDEDDKYVTYKYILSIINKLWCKNIKKNDLQSAKQILNAMCNYFKNVLITDKECYQCFQQFESICFMLLKLVEPSSDTNVKTAQDNIMSYVKIIQKYGYSVAVKVSTFSIIDVLEEVIMHWESCLKVGQKMFLKNNILTEVMNLVDHISTFLLQNQINNCKTCQDLNCTLRKDIYNAVVIKIKCLSLVSKLTADDLSKEVCVLARKFFEQNMASIYEIKQCKCKCWIQLWRTSGVLIYNVGITAQHYYEESILLFSLLCTSAIQFEGVQTKSLHLDLQNPISSSLHRLSNAHFKNGMYREAMTASALNALLTYNDPQSKAFRMWSNIKHKCSISNGNNKTSEDILKMTILSCLKADETKIRKLGLTIELSKYDLKAVCLREVRGLQEAKVNLSSAILKVLEEIISLKATPIEYACAVQLLGHHLLNFEHDEDISQYLKDAIKNLKKVKRSASALCLEANLEFYSFVHQLHTTMKQTEIEMKDIKLPLRAPQLSEFGEMESCDVVPAYSMINLKEDYKLMMCLQKILRKWKECMKQNIEQIIEDADALTTIRILRIAGEYSRLYRYQKYEISIWKLVYNLACELKDHHTIIYAVGRSISLRQINQNWITVAKDLVTKFKNTNDDDIIYATAIFWISLSDFYFECGMYDEARKLLDNVRKLPGISFVSNIAVYLYSLDRILYNCDLYKEDITHEEYTQYIVEILYTLLNLDEELNARKWKPQDKYLFGYNVLFSTTVNLTLRMNSLLSSREIGAHLARRLKTAQHLGAILRIAEILKSLCYMDLSCSDINNCEVKLQGLERILNIETFQLSMKANITNIPPENCMATPIRIMDTVRDIPQNDTSPILRNKVFNLPEFISHRNCNCYICQNTLYHYLVLASTHIRAQLYALQKNFTSALQHFEGAFKIKEFLVKNRTQTGDTLQKYKNKSFFWQERYYIIDYVLLLLNFSNFLKSYMKTKQKQVTDTILLAIELCEMHNLKGHPMYMSAKEMLLDNYFQTAFNDLSYSTFTVPETSEINVSKYNQDSTTEQNICTTPTVNTNYKRKPIGLRHNRTPPAIKITKVSMIFSDDDDIDSPPRPIRRRTRSQSKLTKRKLVDEEHIENCAMTTEKNIESGNKSLTKDDQDTNKESTENVSVKDIVIKIATLVPDVSENLYKLADNLDIPVTNENVKKSIEMVENLKISTDSQRNGRSVRITRSSNSKPHTIDYNKKITEIVELFKDMTVNKEKDSDDFLKTKSVMFENSTDSASFNKTSTFLSEKQHLTAAENDTKKLHQHSSSFKQYKKDNLDREHVAEVTRLKSRKHSLKRGMRKETQNVKLENS